MPIGLCGKAAGRIVAYQSDICRMRPVGYLQRAAGRSARVGGLRIGAEGDIR